MAAPPAAGPGPWNSRPAATDPASAFIAVFPRMEADRGERSCGKTMVPGAGAVDRGMDRDRRPGRPANDGGDAFSGARISSDTRSCPGGPHAGTGPKPVMVARQVP